jgi:hypothetical protein
MKLSGIKTACVVQGNIRRGTRETMAALAGHFDILILSTWKEDKSKLPDGRFEVILNEVPHCKGQAYRNCQRLGTDAGLNLAEKLGCNYVLKWRTDMLPTKLDVNRLLCMSQYNVPQDVSSRIVMCDFRNMSVDPDWFSSIPDFFAFGHIDMIKMLWSADGFDFLMPINPPEEMKRDLDIQWFNGDIDKACTIFPPEAELYANFKSRLMKKTARQLNHTTIAREYLYLADYRKFGICWFAPDQGFRPIGITYRYPWWTESVWKGDKSFVISSEILQNPQKYVWQKKVAYELRKFSRKRSYLEQQIWLNAYQGKKDFLLKRLLLSLKYFWLNTASNILMKVWRMLQTLTKP